MVIKSPDVKGHTATEVATIEASTVPIAGDLPLEKAVSEIVLLTASANPMRRALVSAVLLAMFGEKPIPQSPTCVGDAITLLVRKVDEGVIDRVNLEVALNKVVRNSRAGKWSELVTLVPTTAPVPSVATAAPAATPPPPPEPEPTKFSMPHVGAPAKLEYPEIKDVAIPHVSVTPTDPMSSMASAIMGLISQTVFSIADWSRMQTLEALQPALEKLHTAANRPIPIPSGGGGRGGSATNEEDVSRIIDARLSNGAGEIVRSAVATNVPSVISEFLEAAAKAVADRAPKEDHGKAVLKADYIPLPDPRYAWDDNLSTAAEIIEAASATEPQNAMLVGPTGAGKTEFAIQFAARYSRPVLVIDCANVREAREWFGIKGASNGATYFRKAQFWLAVEAGGFVIVLDEFNRASDYVRNPLMPLLDHRRCSFIEEVGESLRVGPGTIFFANGNEGLDYSGTHAVDRALKNRFPRRIEITYLPEDKETAVLMDKVPGLGKRDAESLVSIANTIRQKASSFGGGLSETISTRQLIAAARDFTRVGPKSFMFTVFSHFSTEGGKDSERATVVNMFQLKGYSL